MESSSWYSRSDVNLVLANSSNKLTIRHIIDEDECRRLKLDPRNQQHLQSLHHLEQNVKDEMQQLTKALKTPVNADFYEELMKKRGLYEYLNKYIQYSRTRIFATTRNTKIRKSLQDWYRGRTKEPNPLHIFCVSSKVNMEHVRGYAAAEFPRLSLAMTEIPALRSHIFSLAAKSSRVEQFQRHCVFIRVLLHEMELSCLGSRPMMKRDHLLKILLDVQMKQDHFEVLMADFVKNSVTPVVAKIDASTDAWLAVAQGFCKKWSSYTPQGFTAFLNHQGKWQTFKCGKADWNQDLMSSSRRGLQETFDVLREQECLSFRTRAIQHVNDLLKALEEKMKINLDISQSAAFRPFFGSFHQRKQEMTLIVNEVVNEMRTSLLAINNNAFNLGQTSPLTGRMLKIYEKAKAEKPRKGGALHVAKKARFSALVCHRTEGAYPAVKKFVEVALEKTVKSVESKLTTRCGAVLDAILRDFDSVCPESEDRGVLTLQRREISGRKVQESKR
ncbi:hypothetical protein P171DRAFT_480221 [Karstenula rhodostoma CBS 690.94]|uniref:DUF7605 domain-containing protein n=1 Tax=Karstenula rhodostoma CBS 690.94 TaxID=1392251 RepID=A0A9P4PS05_9PLEO|nr:hypothetical protein P171DRAFT_480221 [Karstenula rhodostoma CBS 690.94]